MQSSPLPSYQPSLDDVDCSIACRYLSSSSASETASNVCEVGPITLSAAFLSSVLSAFTTSSSFSLPCRDASAGDDVQVTVRRTSIRVTSASSQQLRHSFRISSSSSTTSLRIQCPAASRFLLTDTVTERRFEGDCGDPAACDRLVLLVRLLIEKPDFEATEEVEKAAKVERKRTDEAMDKEAERRRQEEERAIQQPAASETEQQEAERRKDSTEESKVMEAQSAPAVAASGSAAAVLPQGAEPQQHATPIIETASAAASKAAATEERKEAATVVSGVATFPTAATQPAASSPRSSTATAASAVAASSPPLTSAASSSSPSPSATAAPVLEVVLLPAGQHKQLLSASASLSSLSAAHSALVSAHAQLTAQKQAAETQYRTDQSGFARQLSLLLQEKEKREEDVRGLRVELETVKRLLRDVSDQQAKEREEAVKSRDELKAWKGKDADWSKEREELRARSKRELEEARKQADDSKRQTEETRKQAEDARRQAEEARKQSEELKKQAEEQRKTAEEARKTSEEAKKEAESAREDAKRREEKAASKAAAIEAGLRKELELYRKELGKMKEKEARVDVLEMENHKLMREMEFIRAERRREEEERKAAEDGGKAGGAGAAVSAAVSREREEERELQWREREERVRQLETLVDNRQREIEELHEIGISMADKEMQMESDMRRLQAEVDSLSSQLQTLSVQREEHREAALKAEAELQRLRERLDELESANNYSKKKIVTLTQQIEKSIRERAALKQQHQDELMRVGDEREELKELRRENATLKVDADKYRTAYNELILGRPTTPPSTPSTAASASAPVAPAVDLSLSPSQLSQLESMRDLVTVLTDQLTDKELAFSHLRKTNQILGIRVKELEERFRAELAKDGGGAGTSSGRGAAAAPTAKMGSNGVRR